jgi:hypothetical protein
MRAVVVVVLTLAWFAVVPAARAGQVADLKADWSDSNNPNPVTFGTWYYLEGGALLPHVSNWNGNGTVGFTTTQPAWAPSNNLGDYVPAEFKAKSVPTGISGGTKIDWQVGDIIAHSTGTNNSDSNGPSIFLWKSPIMGTITISGSVWEAATFPGRDNSWALEVNGLDVSTGASIDGHDRAHPFLLAMEPAAPQS